MVMDLMNSLLERLEIVETEAAEMVVKYAYTIELEEVTHWMVRL